jgi:hypothetical protein
MRKMVLDPALNINPDSHRLLLEYQCYTIRNFKFHCDYPYKLSDEELKNIETPLYLILCENDNLIQQKKTVERAKKIIPGFRQHSMLSAIGHGIEMSKAAYVEFEKFLNIEYKTDNSKRLYFTYNLFELSVLKKKINPALLLSYAHVLSIKFYAFEYFRALFQHIHLLLYIP